MLLTSHEISCVIIPMRDRQLLVPNVSVAEIIEFHFFQQAGESKAALIGKVKWRGIDVPVIDFDLSCDKEVKRLAPRRIAIMNQVSANEDGQNFFGIAAMDLPRLVKVTRSSLKEETTLPHIDQHTCVKLEDESVVIPDLTLLEKTAFA